MAKTQTKNTSLNFDRTRYRSLIHQEKAQLQARAYQELSLSSTAKDFVSTIPEVLVAARMQQRLHLNFGYTSPYNQAAIASYKADYQQSVEDQLS